MSISCFLLVRNTMPCGYNLSKSFSFLKSKMPIGCILDQYCPSSGKCHFAICCVKIDQIQTRKNSVFGHLRSDNFDQILLTYYCREMVSYSFLKN